MAALPSPGDERSVPVGMARVEFLRADARELPLADQSVDLVVTSPPYWGLRDYRDRGASLSGQIGAETTPAEYIRALMDCTREWVRVLKPQGSLWINLGDRYSHAGGGPPNLGHSDRTRHNPGATQRRSRAAAGYARKSLLGLPWRYAIGCVDDLGLILRAEVIWSKRNGLPESVRDRVRRSHEHWFHLVTRPTYYSAVDDIRRPGPAGGAGRVPGSVWHLSTRPLRPPRHLGVGHYAAFPPDLIRPIICGWSPPSICTRCGQGRTPVRRSTPQPQHHRRIDQPTQHGANPSGRSTHGRNRRVDPTGHRCGCPTADAPVTPATVLDPFGGTGTTALVAAAHGRHAIHNDLSQDYNRLAHWRINDSRQQQLARDTHRAHRNPT